MCYDYRMIAMFYASMQCDLNEKEQEQKKGNKEHQQKNVVCESLNHHVHVTFYESSSMSSSIHQRLCAHFLPPPPPPLPPNPLPTPPHSNV